MEESAVTGEGGEVLTREKRIELAVIDVLKTIYDPEIPVNIYDLGLIYEVNVEALSFVRIKMTLTAPACPVAGTLPGEVQEKVKSVAGVADAQVDLVWEPNWSKEMMSEEARLMLNLW
ncbi:MAG: SUF system Fe-S cluster assembly protein [Bacteroidetes bacterium]|nr:SUF system Fe-S cluster assembly protein [Bacteroidota bacterium]